MQNHPRATAEQREVPRLPSVARDDSVKQQQRKAKTPEMERAVRLNFRLRRDSSAVGDPQAEPPTSHNGTSGPEQLPVSPRSSRILGSLPVGL